MAHEHQHIKHQDVTGLRWCVTLARLFTMSVAVMAGAAVLPPLAVAALVPVVGKGWSAVASLAYLAAVAFVMLRTMGLWFPLTSREARAHRTRELRCDLAAVQLVGRNEVLAMLEDLEALEQRRAVKAAAKHSWTRHLVTRTQPTHPPTQLRIKAVTAYDPTEDPGTSARRFLTAPSAPHDSSRP